MQHHIYTLRQVAEHVGALPLKVVVREPTVRAVYRVTVVYSDRRACDSVATLTWRTETQPERLAATAQTDALLSIAFRGAFGHQPLQYVIPAARYQALALALQHLQFDKLADQTNIPFFGADLWLVERGAGSFLKSVLLSPQAPPAEYAGLVDTLRQQLPEAFREIPN